LSPKVDEAKYQKLSHLVEVLKDTNLDFNWVLSIAALSAQELAIKKKLDEFGASYPEGEDFQKIADKLKKEFEKRSLDVPLILLSIARSYRHIRANLIHMGHKSKPSDIDTDAIVYNTEALVSSLFKKPAIAEIPKIPQFVESINQLPVQKVLKKFNDFNLEEKKQIIIAILGEISLLDRSDISANEKLFQFLDLAIKSEKESRTRIELFGVFFDTFPSRIIRFGKDKLLSIIAEYTRIAPVKKWVSEKAERVNWLVSEFKGSYSFATAGINAQIIANLAPILNKKQANEIIEAASSNAQIYFSYEAQSHLKGLLPFWEDKVEKSKLEALRKKLEGKL